MAAATSYAMPASAIAAEGEVVPPSNSAAAQYTEAFPTSGGDKKTDQAAHHRSPVSVLGSSKSKKLEKEGPEGKAAAEVAAATAPSSIGGSQPPDGSQPSHAPAGQSGNGGGQGEGGASSPPQSTSGHKGNRNGSAGSAQTTSQPTEPSGSSGVGSAIGQATGFSTGGRSGILLPLVILATILWSLIYLWRQRRQVD